MTAETCRASAIPVIHALRHVDSFAGGLWLTLAALALVVKVLVPSGYMVAGPQDGAPFPLVICTAQGAMVLDADAAGGDHDGSPDGSAHDSPCAFAGAGFAAAPPILAELRLPAAASTARPALGIRDLAPGRGLAAPPPPARGPPVLTA